ncbi:SCO family protein [Phenylobacterium sp.]|uniref:SCO family protein n=1 Tax=Phenylobacterium sp. TaxID=1871053 RepID=UPI003D2DA8BD
MKRRRLLISVMAALAATACRPVQGSQADAVRIGGSFTLVGVDGRPVTERDLLGKPTAIFFGFTFCPEVCPTTLAVMSQALKDLGPDAARVNVVFVSVDPERDTPDRMKLYLSNFDPRIRGLTGSLAQVDAAAKAYRVYHQKVATPGGYTVDHSSAVYLFDRKGTFVEPIRYGASADEIVARILPLVGKAPA